MGFFQDSKPPEPAPRQTIQQPQWWPAALAALILTGIGMVLGWILKPLLTYLFTFEGRTSEQKKTQVALIVVLFGSLLFGLYSIPRVRDFVSLSPTHTLNHSKWGGRIFFPEREYFLPEGSRRGIQVGSKTYITYAGYTQNVMQKVKTDDCPMVPRSQRIGLTSLNQPEGAEGFEDEVNYTVTQSVGSLTGFDYVAARIAQPRTWFKKQEADEVMVDRKRAEPWKRFIDDWDIVRTDNGSYRSFEIEALAREHAVICF